MSVATNQNSPISTAEDQGKISKVIVLDDLALEGLEKLKSASGIEFDIKTGLSGEELRSELAQYDGAVCRSGVKITADSLEGNKRLKAIVRAGVGTDNIDKQAATRLGIVVMNTPAGNTISTAEHTVALMLGLSRKVAPAYASLKAGKWDRKKFKGSQLFGKTLGVIGLGRIGQEVSSRAKAFGMEVVGYDPFLTNERAKELGITKVAEVADLLPQIDYLTVHTPLTPETEGLIGNDEVGLLKKGAMLINCARGGIYENGALVAGLESGHLGGVALDVYPDEPCTDNPLFQMDNVLCTPHLGASTEEAQIGVAVEAVDLLVNFLNTGEIRSAVNTISLDPATLNSLRSYLDVALRLGLFLSQWHGGAVQSCELEFQGEIASKDTRLLVSAFCAGLLGRITEDASIINAEVLCRDRGIDIVRKSTGERGAFASVISASLSGDGKSVRASGTLFGHNMPRLVRLGDHRIETYLDGSLLIFSHNDIPGIIGYVGNVLANESVNIGHMAVGRSSSHPGGHAIGVLNVDSVVTGTTRQKILENDAIDSVEMIELPAIGELPDWLQ
ncbi:MAG: phosphoglycerate dehydrogenase [Planctomycetota bacterium]